MDIQVICPSCGEEKMIEHMLFLCPFARWVWLLASLYHRIVQAEDPIDAFIDLLKRRVEDDVSSESTVKAAYIA